MSSLYMNELILISALGCGLVAGIFFAFSNFVMAGLGRIPSEQGIAAMQSINITVINRGFMSLFFGTAVGCIVLAIVALTSQSELATYLVAGSVLYVVGTILVTMFFNVPLNHSLKAVNPGSAEGAELWNRYLSSWTTWNSIRTIASIAAMILLILAIRW